MQLVFLEVSRLLGVSQVASKISLIRPEMAVFEQFFFKKN